MARRRSKPTSAGDLPGGVTPPGSFAETVKMLQEISGLLSQHNFASLEEVTDFMERIEALSVPILSQEPLAAGPPLVFGEPGRNPLDRAQEKIFQAWEAPSRKRRIELAREALRISPDCADAYVLLAQVTAKSAEEAKPLYEAGVEAGERAIGPQAFKEYSGMFWGIIETRPYMRAREGLAGALWELGERDEAIRHYQEMLRLNPHDNQGIRYTLLARLLETGKDEEFRRLLKAYDDGMAMWLYPRALFTFRTKGASKTAERHLAEALRQNPLVPEYLLGRKKLPRRMPDFYGWGDQNEAILYAAEGQRLWQETPGALEWLERRAAT